MDSTGSSSASSSSEVDFDHVLASDVIRKRRSAHAFDSSVSLSRENFLIMMNRLLLPFHTMLLQKDTIHIPFVAVFVHRVDGLVSGQYVLIRDPSFAHKLEHEILKVEEWTQVTESLFLIKQGNMQHDAKTVSCDQDIAGQGVFTIGAFANVTNVIEGGHQYRRMYWEAGAIGHMLYLDSTGIGQGATGIGCFEDIPMRKLWVREDEHENVTGGEEKQQQQQQQQQQNSSHFQHFLPLYHVAVGKPKKDSVFVDLPPYDHFV